MATVKGTTTDTFVKLWDWETAYTTGKKTIRITNTDAANSLDYQVKTIDYLNGEENLYESGTIAAGNFTLVVFDRDLAQINLYLKSTTAGSAATFTVENFLTNPEIGFLQVFKDPLVTFNRTYNFLGWTTKANMNTARGNLSAFGSSSTDGTAVGGYNSSFISQTTTETYNGTAWTTETNMNVAEAESSSFGSSSTDGIIAGGYKDVTTPTNAIIQLYNGTTWTTGTNMNAIRRGATAFGSSSSDGTIVEGTDGTNKINTAETYNGTSWINITNSLLARVNLSSFGSSSTDGTTVEGGA